MMVMGSGGLAKSLGTFYYPVWWIWQEIDEPLSNFFQKTAYYCFQ